MQIRALFVVFALSSVSVTVAFAHVDMANVGPGNCSFNAGGVAFNFTHLIRSGPNGTNVDYRCVQPNCPDTTYDYFYNVCNASSSSGECAKRGFGACQYTTHGMFVAGLGRWNNSRWSLIDPSFPEHGVQILMTDGDRCFSQGQWITRKHLIYLICYERTERDVSVAEDPSTCTITTKHHVECRIVDRRSSTGGQPRSSSGGHRPASSTGAHPLSSSGRAPLSSSGRGPTSSGRDPVTSSGRGPTSSGRDPVTSSGRDPVTSSGGGQDGEELIASPAASDSSAAYRVLPFRLDTAAGAMLALLMAIRLLCSDI